MSTHFSLTPAATLVHFFLKFHHVYTFLPHARSYFGALLLWEVFLHLLHAQLALHDLLLAGLWPGAVHHLQVADRPLLLHHLVTHLHDTLVLVSCHIFAHLYFGGHHLWHHDHVALLHVDRVAHAALLLLHVVTRALVHHHQPRHVHHTRVQDGQAPDDHHTSHDLQSRNNITDSYNICKDIQGEGAAAQPVF